MFAFYFVIVDNLHHKLISSTENRMIGVPIDQPSASNVIDSADMEYNTAPQPITQTDDLVDISISTVRQLVYLREHYTIFRNDTADMKRTSSSADTIHIHCKILEFYCRNNDQVQRRISQKILNLQFCIYLLYRSVASG
ncbi:hypothetical protein CEXT_178921 [Caerostris extrusa]|uniref:Uncharacterized protein n=1 Tax=Caerostris extrusa TaxID=172846 RepID=A0AAV4P0I0_CAEEX|nr:hypothetical protein CEXT_178921 [Caerostris extrusa]